MNLEMPDVELLVLDALREYLSSSKVYTAVPKDWDDQIPMTVVSWRGGAPSQWPERLQITDILVKTFGRTRKEGSDLYREVDKALRQACISRFNNKGLSGVDVPGVLTHVKVISPQGIEFEGLTSKHPDSVLFEGIFRITSAPLI